MVGGVDLWMRDWLGLRRGEARVLPGRRDGGGRRVDLREVGWYSVSESMSSASEFAFVVESSASLSSIGAFARR